MTKNIYYSIIKILYNIGEVFVEGFAELNTLAESQGFAGAMALLLVFAIIILIGMFAKQMKNLANAITVLTEKVSSPYLDHKQSLVVYRAIMTEQIQRKVNLLRDILVKNSIHERREQIESNIEIEFKHITSVECEKLSNFKTVCGDMGKCVKDELDWEKLLQSIYKAFFSRDDIDRKLTDVKLLLNEETERIAEIIEEHGIYN